MRVYVGCSGFYYKDWVGNFYPTSLKREDYLRFYAKHFEVVEVNASFYTFPNRGTVKSMLSRAPNLRFAFKAHRSFTHTRNYTEEGAKKFLQALEPVLAEDRFVALLFQFPESFGYGQEQVEYIKGLSKAFRGLPKVVEVRNKSFKKADFYALVQEMGFSMVNVDAPKGEGFLVGPWVGVGEINYLRLHGRDPQRPYDYLYSLEELRKLKDKLRKLPKRETFVFFNNTLRAQAVLNALQFKLLLGLPAEVPASLEKSLRESEWE